MFSSKKNGKMFYLLNKSNHHGADIIDWKPIVTITRWRVPL